MSACWPGPVSRCRQLPVRRAGLPLLHLRVSVGKAWLGFGGLFWTVWPEADGVLTSGHHEVTGPCLGCGGRVMVRPVVVFVAGPWGVGPGHEESPPPDEGRAFETSRAHARSIDQESNPRSLYAGRVLSRRVVRAGGGTGVAVRGRVWGVAVARGPGCAAVGCEPHAASRPCDYQSPGLAAISTQRPDICEGKGAGGRSLVWVTAKPRQPGHLNISQTGWVTCKNGPAPRVKRNAGPCVPFATSGGPLRAVGAGRRPGPLPGSRSGTGSRTPGCRRRTSPAPAPRA